MDYIHMDEFVSHQLHYLGLAMFLSYPWDPYGIQSHSENGFVEPKYYAEDVIVYIPIIWVVVSNIFYFHPYLGK